MDGIRTHSLDDPISVALITQLLADLRERYGEDDIGDTAADEFMPPDGVFLVAHEAGRPVACGGLRRYADRTAEIKRMYVEPASRGRGLSRQILDALERFAVEAGYDEIQLETGARQPEAMRLYESAGYQRIPNYGIYADEPLSVCFARRLARP